MKHEIIDAFSAFEAIEATTSRTEKEDILKANKDNEVLQNLLVKTYNPFIVFGIKKAPKVDPVPGNEVSEEMYDSFLSLLDLLQNREITGNLAITKVANFFGLLSEREYKWYLKVLQRDLKIGITEKTVNKIWKKLVPEFTCALANNYDPKKLPAEYIADTKLDGYRCLAFHYGDSVELRSRNGHLLEGYYGIEKDVLDYLVPGFVYDGEITGRQGTFNEVQKSAFKKKDEADKDGILNIFDVVSVQEFESNEFKVPYRARIAFLDQITDVITRCRSLDRVHPSKEFKKSSEEDFEALLTMHAQYTNMGMEGTMIKDLNANYKMGKSNNIMKLKDFYEIDLTVESVYKGKTGTKYQDVMGGVIVRVSDKDIIEQCPVDDPKHTKKLKYVTGCTAEVGVGSGWNDLQRLEFLDNPNLIVGKTITISFQETSINEKGEHSLRFPTLVKIRDDK